MTDTLLDAIHDTATGLHRAGVMDTKTLREFDALCLPPITQYSAEEIKQIRLQNKASQAVFAAYLNVSVSTVQKWERGQKIPNGPSLKLLNMVASKGIEALV